MKIVRLKKELQIRSICCIIMVDKITSKSSKLGSD